MDEHRNNQRGESHEFVLRRKKVMAQQFWPEVKPWPVGVWQPFADINTYWCERPNTANPIINPGDWIIEGHDKPMTNEEFEAAYEQV